MTGTKPPTRLLSVAVALFLTACAGQDLGARATAADEQPGPVHAHGIGVDPESSAIYVATHTGLWEVGPDAPERVGDAYHDLMGFTVAGPDDYLASGHPDLRDPTLQEPGAPPLLGLVTSDDPASGWRAVSLLGKVDFHTLQAVHGRVYGWDATSGRIMVSTDRRRWETRATLALSDFVVSPGDPDLLVGANDEGLLRSSDGGRTWSRVGSQPITQLAWSRQRLVAADDEGNLLEAKADPHRLTQVKWLGGPVEALALDGGRVLAFVSGRGLLVSDQVLDDWELRLPLR